MKCNDFRSKVIDGLKVHMLKRVHKLIYMKEEDQFIKLWDYCHGIASTAQVYLFQCLHFRIGFI